MNRWNVRFFYDVTSWQEAAFVFRADVKCKVRQQECSLGSSNRYIAALRNAVQHVPQGQLLWPTMATAKRCSATKHMHAFQLHSPITGPFSHHSMLIRMAWGGSHTERNCAYIFTEQVRVVVIL